MKFLCILVVVASLSACNRQPMAAPDHVSTVESAIIVIPGYYGTRLVQEADGKLIFISLSQALFGDQTLTLPVPGLGFQGTVELEPEGILEEVNVIPFFYSIDVYGTLIDQLRLTTKKNRKVIPLDYDWRGDLMEAVRDLDNLIRQLQIEGINDITVVAHSMGGLIASYYLRYGTQDIESATETWEGAELLTNIVMAGVPFLGVMHSFRNMNFGVTVGFNTSLLSAEAYASFPASYFTLPLANADELFTPELQPLKGMIRNEKHWRQSKWGLFNTSQPFSNAIIEQRAIYTSFWLHRSQRFLELLLAPQATTNPAQTPLLYVYAKGTPTLNKGVWVSSHEKGQDSLMFTDPDSTQSNLMMSPTTVYADGDGTVTVQSAFLPSAYRQTLPTTIREYTVGHTELVQNTDILHNIITFLSSHES